MLILGGTGFIGPHIVDVAKARGYTITLFNRGKTRPNLFPDLEKLHGDRDPNKGDGLKALEGRSWEVVIDTSGPNTLVTSRKPGDLPAFEEALLGVLAAA